MTVDDQLDIKQNDEERKISLHRIIVTQVFTTQISVKIAILQ
jgi:hypothetical protein